MQRIRQGLAYFVVRLLICVIQAMRIETCQELARWVAWLASDVLGIRRRVMQENIRESFPEAPPAEHARIARQMWEHLILMVCEIMHAPRKIHTTNWRKYFDVVRVRQFVGLLLDHRPTVIVSGHYGNFELAGFSLGLLGFRSYTIARPLDNPVLHDFITRFRERQGQFILPKQGSAPAAQRVLDEGGVLCLLADQHAGPKGCWVDFLGRPASYHKALALFSLSVDAPMLVSFARRTGGPMRITIGLQGVSDPLENGPERAHVAALTTWYNGKLEEVIRSEPGQYWWLHRRWRDPPARVLKKRQRAAA